MDHEGSEDEGSITKDFIKPSLRFGALGGKPLLDCTALQKTCQADLHASFSSFSYTDLLHTYKRYLYFVDSGCG